MTIQIYAMVHGAYSDCKRYVCSVFCDSIAFTDGAIGDLWFVAQSKGVAVLSGEVSRLHGKGNKTFEFIRDLR